MTRRARTPPRTAIAVALLSAVLVAAGPIGSRAQVSSDVIAAAISETVQLIIVDKDAHQLGTCSGSFVTPGGLILTAGHCVRAVNNEFAKAGIQLNFSSDSAVIGTARSGLDDVLGCRAPVGMVPFDCHDTTESSYARGPAGARRRAYPRGGTGDPANV